MDPEKSISDQTGNPNIEIAQLKFALSLPEYYKDETMISELQNLIFAGDMAPYYEIVCRDLNWIIDETLLEEMKSRNVKAIEEFDETIDKALTSASLIEVKEAYLNKANYLSRIGDKENAIKILSQAFDRTVALGYKLDNVFHCIRIGLFFMDNDLIRRNLQRAESLIDQGANWHSRNCYKMLKAIYSLYTRDFLTASKLLVGAVSTFVCTELISFDYFIKYTVLSGVLALSRAEVKKDLIENPDVQQALHSTDVLREYLSSLYYGEYKLFFQRLGDCELIMKKDMLLNPHYKYYVREMKVKAYDQLLSTYISVKLTYMADQFGVSKDFIENEVSKLIAAGRLNYRIDKVNQTIVNKGKDTKNEVFKAVLKHGDLLLNRIQKLTRVINI
nr:26S proteasome non-ATPase regulatory subunit 6-like [Leptinotarsa decemlineata]